MKLPTLLLICIATGIFQSYAKTGSAPAINGEPFIWNTLTFSFEGPQASETEDTFLNYRLSVSFSKDGVIYKVPGYFAADGDPGHSHATEGNIWRANFTPPKPGVWTYQATLVYGDKVAIDASVEGKTLNLSPTSGTFEVYPQAPQLEEKDFRTKGRLQYVGKRYLQFAGSGQYFLKEGKPSQLNLSDAKGSLQVFWFNPRTGGELQTGSVKTVDAGNWVELGNPPSDSERDWAVLLKR